MDFPPHDDVDADGQVRPSFHALPDLPADDDPTPAIGWTSLAVALLLMTAYLAFVAALAWQRL